MLAALRRTNPFGPIFVKELRALSRRRRTYLLRFVYLGLLLVFLLLGSYASANAFHGSGGGIAEQIARQNRLASTFFATFTIYSILTLALIGPVLTCTAINAEKLARTLDVLLMTPLNAWQIVSGKLASRLLAAFTLLGLSLPVLAVVRLLGGVEVEQMFAVVALAAATATSGAALALCLSTVVRRAYSVLLLSFAFLILAYAVLPLLVALGSVNSGGMPGRGFGTLLSLNPVVMGIIQFDRPPFWTLEWTTTVAIHFAFALVMTIVAAVLVRRLARGGGGGEVPAPGVADALLGRPPRPVGDNPVRWREVRRPLFNRRWQRVVAVLAVLGMLGYSYYAIAADSGSRNWLIEDEETHLGYVFLFHTLMWILVSVLSATAIAHEKETDTWTLLIATPLSGRQIVWGKLVGVLGKLLWPALLPAAHLAVFAALGTLSWQAAVLCVAVMLCFLTPWLVAGLWLSLAVKKVTAAVVLSLLIPLLVFVLIPILLTIVDDDYAEIILPILPYYYQAYAIEQLSPFDPSPTNLNHSFDPLGLRLSDGQFVTLAVGACGVNLLLAGALLALLVLRFDRTVGRAGAGETTVSGAV